MSSENTSSVRLCECVLEDSKTDEDVVARSFGCFVACDLEVADPLSRETQFKVEANAPELPSCRRSA